MLSEEKSKIANELFAKAHSNLDTPLIGECFTPVCLSCTNYQRGKSIDPSTCKVYGEIPYDFIHCKSVDCPHYDLIPNCHKASLPHIPKD